VGISSSDVVAILGREPDVLIPSDREIPRTVNEGVAIVDTRPQSEPAQAFRALAHLILDKQLATAVPARGEPRKKLFRRA
jgi:MinD-like ATPase involved in chromosome partitioning or flagellar assembly